MSPAGRRRRLTGRTIGSKTGRRSRILRTQPTWRMAIVGEEPIKTMGVGGYQGGGWMQLAGGGQRLDGQVIGDHVAGVVNQSLPVRRSVAASIRASGSGQ